MDWNQLWKHYVKFYYFTPEEVTPYFIQWVVWCWRKPVWIGLPLIPLTYILIVIDLVLLVIWLVAHWGKKGKK